MRGYEDGFIFIVPVRGEGRGPPPGRDVRWGITVDIGASQSHNRVSPLFFNVLGGLSFDPDLPGFSLIFFSLQVAHPMLNFPQL